MQHGDEGDGVKERVLNSILTKRRALYSDDELYRYLLEVIWDDSLSAMMVIGLNPSTATEVANDPTLERCERFARAWGYGSLLMTNLFAARSTDPAMMKTWIDPVGPENTLGFLRECADRSQLVLAAWGTHGSWKGRDAEVVRALPKLDCLKITSGGHPGHPLYLPKTLTPFPFNYGKQIGATRPGGEAQQR